MHEIIFAMFGVEWESFQANYDKENPYGMELLESIRVYVDDLDQVKKAAKELTNSGYDVSYVLGAFDDLHGSLTKTYMIYGVLLLLILVLSAINIIVSFEGYLSSMQKDMGIFRHYGYSADRVYCIYKRLITKPYIKIVALMTIYTLALSVALLQSRFALVFFGTFIMILFFVGIVLYILLKSLHVLCRKDIIVLLKQSKEVE